MAEIGQEVHPFTREYFEEEIDKLADKLSGSKASVVEWAVRELQRRVVIRKLKRALNRKGKKRK